MTRRDVTDWLVDDQDEHPIFNGIIWIGLVLAFWGVVLWAVSG